MKKINILKVSIIAILSITTCIFYSCKDESGEFVEQLYTNSQKSNAVKACLKTSADSAVNHLFVYDGFYGHNNYKIDFAPVQYVFDTLAIHGLSHFGDSLVVLTNRMAEGCGAQLSPFIKSAIDTLEIIDPDHLLNGDDDAITNYFKLYEYQYLKSSFQTSVSIRMNIIGINDLWSAALQHFNEYSSQYVNFDMQNFVIDKMIDNIIEEMKIEEYFIRTDSTHRNDDTQTFQLSVR